MSERDVRSSLGAESTIGPKHLIFDRRHPELAERLDPDHFTTALVLGKADDILVDVNQTARGLSHTIEVFTSEHPVISAVAGVAMASLLVGGATRIRQAKA